MHFTWTTMWVWNRLVNRACFHVNGIKRYHWLAIQGIRQCHPCWQCFNKNLIHVPNIWTPTLASYSCGLIQISLTDNDSRMVWDLTSSIYVWHLFLAPTISGFILEVVTKESFLFLLWHSSKKKKKAAWSACLTVPRSSVCVITLTEKHQPYKT